MSGACISKCSGVVSQGIKLLDLGSSPGGWCQVAAKKNKNGKILGIDIKKVEKISGVKFLNGDLLSGGTETQVETDGTHDYWLAPDD